MNVSYSKCFKDIGSLRCRLWLYWCVCVLVRLSDTNSSVTGPEIQAVSMWGDGLKGSKQEFYVYITCGHFVRHIASLAWHQSVCVCVHTGSCRSSIMRKSLSSSSSLVAWFHMKSRLVSLPMLLFDMRKNNLGKSNQQCDLLLLIT